jgi:hypothetical protein
VQARLIGFDGQQIVSPQVLHDLTGRLLIGVQGIKHYQFARQIHALSHLLQHGVGRVPAAR